MKVLHFFGISFDKLLNLRRNEGLPVKISVMYPSGKSEEFILKEKLITLGRSKKCDVVIEDEALSRIHCEIKIEDGQFFVRDLGSSNGVFYDGQKISPNKFVPFSSFIPLVLARNEVFVTDTEPVVVNSVANKETVSAPKKGQTLSKIKNPKSDKIETPKNQKIMLGGTLFLLAALTVFYFQEKPSSTKESSENTSESFETVKAVLNSFYSDEQYKEFESKVSCNPLEICLEFKLSNSLKEGVVKDGKDFLLVKNFPYSSTPIIERKMSFLDSVSKSELMKSIARKEINQVHLILNDTNAKTKEVIRIDGNYFTDDQGEYDTLGFEIRELSHQKNWEGVKKGGIRGFFYKSLSWE